MRVDFIGIRGTQQSSNHNLDFALDTDTTVRCNISWVRAEESYYLLLLHLGQTLGV